MSNETKIMCINAGSSSLKFKLYNVEEGISKKKTLFEKGNCLKAITNGIVERIGHEDAIFSIKNKKGEKVTVTQPVMNHKEAVDLVLNGLLNEGIVSSLDEIKGVGNRVVQGGSYFSDSVIFDEDAERKIASLIPLDPLHAEAHLTCYNAFKKALPNVGEVAVFDTAFHQTMEAKEYMYALPYEYYEKYKVRKYGAHGTSHKYLSIVAKEKYFAGEENINLITCHIGSGASLSAIKAGKCVSTSMGLTPLAGVMMGTRTGDIDPSCMPYLCSCTGKSVDEIYDIFNKNSGLLGISGISNDTRDVEDAYYKGDKRATLAIEMYANKIAEYIMMYYGKLGHVDMIICSAGVFENAPIYREKTFELLNESLGIKIDKEKNEYTRLGKEGIISTPDSKIKVAVIPTDEELLIALDTLRILNINI
ncbi:MAG: acetate kinase [Candidatus Enterosoma sp.]|nr:acetate kinase [Candidatus Enterosoma sp.]